MKRGPKATRVAKNTNTGKAVMDIFFQDPDEIPLPPAEVHIRSLQAKPWPDGKRVRVSIEVDPFQKRPSLELVVRGADRELASTSIIETMVRKMELTMHLRGEKPDGPLTLSAVLFYEEREPPEEEGEELPPAKIQVVDRAETTFDIVEEES
jgi:hypothetical protein